MPMTRRGRWFLRLQGGALAIALIIVILLIHYWPGLQGWATYFGYRPRIFTSQQIGSYALASPTDTVPGLTNFARVSRDLYRAAAADHTGYVSARALGIRTIIDLREVHTDIPSLRGLGLNYVHIPMNPAHTEDHEIADFLHVVRNPDYQPCLVHCAAGSDRTGVTVAVYRVMEQNWPTDAAAAELPRFGFHKVWVPTLEYLRALDRGRVNALAATRQMPPFWKVK